MLPDNIREMNINNGVFQPNPDFILFDDLTDPDRIGREHDSLNAILDSWTDGNNLKFLDLAQDVLKSEDCKRELLADCLRADIESYPGFSPEVDMESVISLPEINFITVLLTGMHPLSGKKVFYLPLPNLMFTRDIGIVLGDIFLITQASHNARKRESIIASFVFKNHPYFAGFKIEEMAELATDKSLEGGDVMVYDEETILIGLSERTPVDSIEAVMKLIFSSGFSRLIVIDLPKRRELMHLDTILTRINTDEFILFPPVFFDGEYADHKIELYEFTEPIPFYKMKPSSTPFLELLCNNGVSLQPIKCGGENLLDQKREQWTDGANAFALAPGKIIGYDRNYKTLDALQNRGYQILSPEKFLNDVANWKQTSEKYIITISGSEMVRGRGGMRCLTLPLAREEHAAA